MKEKLPSRLDRSGKVAYLENKPPNRRRVVQLLSESQRANHWANGGPVSRRLEETIAEMTALHLGRVVVACSSGTAALNALAGLSAVKRGRALRWAVSGYTFFSSFIGPFAGSLVVDCDAEGMLDLEALASVPADSYDGLCVTNLFGLHPDLKRYEDFCRDRDKVLIVDNAQGLFHVDRSRMNGPDEIISFHHSKPWGFGEGGCAIVSKEDARIIRSIINFGVSLPRSAAPFVFNGKMADVAAAYILDRLERLPAWLPRYEKESHRITGIIRRARLSLRLFARNDNRFAGVGHIAFLASHPVGIDQLENGFFVMRKYYRPPPGPGLIRARDLYARMINVPAHSQMPAVPAKSLIEVLAKISAPTG